MVDLSIMLTDLEAVFRSLKSELGLRPVFHHKKDRVRGHLFISVLAYHIVHTMRFALKASEIHLSWCCRALYFWRWLSRDFTAI